MSFSLKKKKNQLIFLGGWCREALSLLAGWQEFLYLGFLFYPETHIAIKGTLYTAVSVYKKQLNPSWVSKKKPGSQHCMCRQSHISQ